MESNQLQRNIQLSIWSRFCLYNWATVPTLALFYLDNGLTLADLFIFKSLLSAVALLAEVPSGYLADVIGRRATALLGCFFWTVSILFYICGDGYYVFLFAELLLGLGLSFYSGVDSALVFDSLKQLGQLERYKKTESRMGSASGFAEAAGGLLGGFLAGFSLLYPFYLQLILVLLAFILIFLIVEPPREKTASKQNPWKGICDALSLTLLKHKGLRSLTLFYSVSTCGTSMLVWLAQGYMNAVQLPVYFFGIAWAVFHIVLALGSLTAHRVDDLLGEFGTLKFLMLLSVISYLMLGVWQSFYGLFFIVLLYLVRGIRIPTFRHHINQHVSSDIRATVLSIQGFSANFFVILLGPMLGYVVDWYSLSTAFILTGILTGFLLCTALLLINRSNVVGS